MKTLTMVCTKESPCSLVSTSNSTMADRKPSELTRVTRTLDSGTSPICEKVVTRASTRPSGTAGGP
eukprot:4342092-Pyramimonas_sp.AAC.2